MIVSIFLIKSGVCVISGTIELRFWEFTKSTDWWPNKAAGNFLGLGNLKFFLSIKIFWSDFLLASSSCVEKYSIKNALFLI